VFQAVWTAARRVSQSTLAVAISVSASTAASVVWAEVV
jgi:hypothetical protein